MVDFNRAFVLITFIRALGPDHLYSNWFKNTVECIDALCKDDFSVFEYQRCWCEYKLADNVFRQLFGW